MANTHGSLHSQPAGESQVFDAGQQKGMLRATGNSTTEHLNCRELPRSLRKAGESRRARRAARNRPSSEWLWQELEQSTVFSHQDLLMEAAHPRVTAASLPLPPPHPIYTLFYSARQRESSLFPNCNRLFLFHPRQYPEDLCCHPLLSRPLSQTCGKRKSRERACREPGALYSERR